MSGDPVGRISGTIVHGFERHMAEFRRLTLRARMHFEQQDWRPAQDDWVARLDSFEHAVRHTLASLATIAGADVSNRQVWIRVKHAYREAISLRHDAELGETFFNSVVRRVFAAVGVDPELQFLEQRPAACPLGPTPPVTCALFRDGVSGSLAVKILDNYRFGVGYEDAARDASVIATAIERQAPGAESVEMAIPVFFRNKGAYLVGCIRYPGGFAPIVIALLNENGRVAVDAVLITEDEASLVFSFTRSYFFVDTACPRELVRFLHAIMPRKPVAELYTSIGHNKHGKTELYRSLRDHLQTTSDRFDTARGSRGTVMIVFTMPSYDVIFKVMRDHFAEPKTCTRQQVMDKYRLVFRHDRAGRLIDAQEFEYLSFDRDRFAPALLDELLTAASETVSLDDNHLVVFRHMYTERRVTPLDVYLVEASREARRDAVIDYGQALRDLAATNIFPGDLLLKNFGVTRHGRLVFYDYDEVSLLTDCRFRRLPVAQTVEEEMAGEPWFHVGENDIFPEEFLPFLGFRGELRDVFLEAHGELLGPDFWCRMQEAQRTGRIADIYPYSSTRRARTTDGARS